jgi:hypothetical protein
VLVGRPGGNEPATQYERGDASVGGREPGRISFVDRSPEDSEAHQYSVTAFDDAGNESAPAGPVRVQISSSALPAGTSPKPRARRPLAALRQRLASTRWPEDAGNQDRS